MDAGPVVQATDTPGVMVDVSVFVTTVLCTLCMEAGQLIRPEEAQTVADTVSVVTVLVTEGPSARFLGADDAAVVVAVVVTMVGGEDLLVIQAAASVVKKRGISVSGEGPHVLPRSSTEAPAAAPMPKVKPWSMVN